MKCPQCGEPIGPGDEVQRLPAPQQAFMGAKSGQMGLYPHKNYPIEEEYVLHLHRCAAAFLDPEQNPQMYDTVVADIRAQITEDIKEELRDEFRVKTLRVMEKIDVNDMNFCSECFADTEDRPEPCTKCGSFNVWLKLGGDGKGTLWCQQCNHAWQETQKRAA
jgi:hypothetical protein